MDHSSPEPVKRPWALSPEQVEERLAVDASHGLSAAEAALRLAQYGPNELLAAAGRPALAIFVDQFKSLLVLLLVVAAALSALFGQWVEALAVLMVPIINGVIGFVTELKATRSVEALRQLGVTRATVRRDGHLLRLPSAQLVPGDVLVLDAGDLVAADARVIRASRLQADESTLTGESLPVAKLAEAAEPEAPLPERAGMLHKGTTITRGSGEAVVVATGMATELGHISALTQSAAPEATPLEKRLNDLGRALVWVTAVVAVLVAATGVGSGRSWLVLLQTAIALAVASVPEGLPVIATLTLARGVKRMADRNALVSRLAAVETLGATTIILSDKTGTLTENRMSVTSFWLPQGEVEPGQVQRRRVNGATAGLRLLEVAALCNNAAPPAGAEAPTGVGDPLEVALLRAVLAEGIDLDELRGQQPRLYEEAFDPDLKMMATAHRLADGAIRVAVKGAPGAVIARCGKVVDSGGADLDLDADGKERWLIRNRQLAEGNLRVLALAESVHQPGSLVPTALLAAAEGGEPELDGLLYQDLTLLGLVGLLDPPRSGVKEAIAACRRAGIRVVMVTGDQPVTARNIAAEVGLGAEQATVLTGVEVAALLDGGETGRSQLLRADILARVSPEQKLRLIELHQRHGAVVAMTGDGVNDAPALRRADIGVAMGLRGTEVAREAADMVLKDDSFATIVAAVREGRVIFDNIRAFVIYLLSCNLSEILVVGLAAAAGYPLPLLPLQILFLNLVTDVFPALALGAGEGDATVLRRRPRPSGEAILAPRHWRTLIGYAVLLTASVLGAFLVALGPLELELAEAVTVSFLALALAQLLHVMNMREVGTGALSNAITRNPWVWAAVLVCLGLLALVLVVPGLSQLLHVVPLTGPGWLLVAGAGLAPALLGAIGKSVGMGRVS